MKPLCRPLSSLAVLALCASLVGCGTDTGAPAMSRTGSPANGEVPHSVPVPEGEVTTRVPVTVLDDGDGPELCLAGVMESLPPQCGGPRLVGWDWHEHDGSYEEVRGTRWGDFVVSGMFDGTSVTPRAVVPADQYDAPPDDGDERLSTSCAEPPAGWVLDPDRVTMTHYDAAMRTASRLDDYASSFVDTSPDPRSPEQIDQDLADGEDDVSSWIVNVAVTEDPDAAAAAIREVWGGGLCLTTAEVTDRELRRVQDAVSDADVPGFLGSGSDADTVHLHVIHDDGSIQAWADQEFGPGLVTVSSALVRTSSG